MTFTIKFQKLMKEVKETDIGINNDQAITMFLRAVEDKVGFWTKRMEGLLRQVEDYDFQTLLDEFNNEFRHRTDNHKKG